MARWRGDTDPVTLTYNELRAAIVDYIAYETTPDEKMAAYAIISKHTSQPIKRLTATGNQDGVTAVAAEFDDEFEAQMAELADMDAVQDDAANRGGY